ncbi:AraC family transcriptional regulator [Adhaeribacter pallidiroseus]|uniref:HTH araC/xylS-type domain-containing protein n=1 Tax=Adhaeribacter pallidiroseus TaxID=2072847 RepID=A0A369QG29_9BACT|nr:helix-turn-helix domain-containing protein [Adhaeribacter pallidiroseus]RDC62186.1 hypothetical protein AHMF7616_00777 [Adhaeribacter pallidiroseus]
MFYRIIPPDRVLQDYVQYFWILKADEKIPVRTFVDDSSGFLFEFTADGTSLRRNMVYGQTTQPTLNPDPASFLALGVLFYPWALQELFRVNASHLTNQRVHLDEFLNFSFLEMLEAEKDFSGKIRLLAQVLTTQAALAQQPDQLMQQMIRYIKQSKGMLSVKSVQGFGHLSEKQLERRFRITIGVSPRHFIKITRFKAALSFMASQPRHSLTDIAYAFNYFDQAHFIKQSNELTGLSPKVLREKRHPGLANIIL